MFERFYRVDKARTRATGGSGLGLAIVHALVVAHGGTATVITDTGRGATFQVTLPLAPSASDRTDPPAVVERARSDDAAPATSRRAASLHHPTTDDPTTADHTPTPGRRPAADGSRATTAQRAGAAAAGPD